MTQRQSFAVLVTHAGIALVVLVASSILCAIGRLDASAVTAIYGAAIALAGGTAQALGSAAINGGPKPDLNRLSDSNPDELTRVLERQQTAKAS